MDEGVPAHRSRPRTVARRCQATPLAPVAPAPSKVEQIRWRREAGSLKARGPVWDVTVQSACMRTGTESLSAWRDGTGL